MADIFLNTCTPIDPFLITATRLAFLLLQKKIATIGITHFKK